MFGPETELLSGRHVIFVQVGPPEAAAEVEALFASTMAQSVHMTLDEHDRVMAFVLGLSHALNLAFAAALAESGEAAPRLAELSSTTFEEQIAVAGRVTLESPHLYFEIQQLNEFGDLALEALETAVTQIRGAVGSADEEAFARIMRTGRAYLASRAVPPPE
jgi:chorismate mutase/prephenate dehydrogenase